MTGMAARIAGVISQAYPKADVDQVLRLVAAPNPLQSGLDLCNDVMEEELLTGKFHLHVVENSLGHPCELYHRPFADVAGKLVTGEYQ